jgi:RHH-type proline utilization regulon transcriptional repressor/proline dehydrogenase/delta 1-pyrroline-5-carboxylate dehydrogenase
LDADFSSYDLACIEAETKALGRVIFDRLKVHHPRIWHWRWWDDRVMRYAMASERVKVRMFRFVDVLPMLGSSRAIVEHLQEYLADVRDELPRVMQMALQSARPDSLIAKGLAFATRKNAANQARRFIAGQNVLEVITAAKSERARKRGFTLDLLGEAVTSEAEADRYSASYLELLEGLPPTINEWPEVPLIDRAILGELPRVNLSLKLSALDSQFDPVDPRGTAERVKSRLRPILRAAQRQRAHIHIDMESYKLKSLTLDIFQEVLLEDEFRQMRDVGIVIQAYLKDAQQDLQQLAAWAKQRGTPIWIRLVKGAYWDYETVLAEQQGWPNPVWERKSETDECYERLTRWLLRHSSLLHPAFGSHNIRSLAHALATARQIGMPLSSLEIQMLYGMAEPEQEVLTQMGYRVRTYMPFGELIPGMAYLVRRLLENTSNDSFLRASFSTLLPTEQLLMNPAEISKKTAAKPALTTSAVGETSDWQSAFRNEPLADFAVEVNRTAMASAIGVVRQQLGKQYPLVIAGEEAKTQEFLASHNPSQREEVIGYVASAEVTHAKQAVAAAKAALPSWSGLPMSERAALLRKTAQLMRERRYELSAWQILECGKTWREADGDVCEAIDFCEYYAAGGLALASDRGVNVAGEENQTEYLPRGVAAIIAPWNFPLAILTGMTTAALVMGNTVVMKPAEQSSVVAAGLMQLLRAAGFPRGVVNFLPGKGEIVGAELVKHRDVALVAFTGSRAVGLSIQKEAAIASAAGTPVIKHVVAELGGKNGIIIDDDADLDEAVLGVMKSAFGYQGQKCSACSRVIVLEAVYDAFVSRLIEATRSLKIGPAEDSATSVGPVIDDESLKRIQSYIELGKSSAKTLLAMDAGSLSKVGNFVGPHIFGNVDAKSRLAQEEIFGPVLAVLRAKTFAEALEIANDTEYALTGGVFSRSPVHLQAARRSFLVGNLYLNRGITGALVNRQPFGGFKMSGLGSKAGGPDYLLHFTLPRTITENTLRRGFAPTE